MIKRRAIKGSALFKKLDLFEKGVPNFNLAGKKHEGTYFGSLVSIIFVLLVILYTNLKF